MREFGIPFVKGLMRGLRAFPAPIPGEEELVECHNLVPSENSLRGHEAILAVGLTAPILEYLAIKDQSDNIWYWIADRNLGTIVSPTLPSVSGLGFTLANITPATIPYWLQVDAANDVATQLYIFPLEFNGDLMVDTSPPAIGTGYDVGAGLDFRSLSGWKHRLSAITSLDHFWRRVGD